jgi:hypothetical protein
MDWDADDYSGQLAMTAEELIHDNLKAIRQARRAAPAEGIANPIVMVFDMSDERSAELATHVFQQHLELLDKKVSIWTKPVHLCFNWAIQQLDDEKLAGELKAPENDAEITVLAFTADGIEQFTGLS